jgi:hypothetical protein
MTNRIMCPIQQGAEILTRLLETPRTDQQTFINTYRSGSSTFTLTADTALARIW